MIRLFSFSLYFWSWYENISFEYFQPHQVYWSSIFAVCLRVWWRVDVPLQIPGSGPNCQQLLQGNSLFESLIRGCSAIRSSRFKRWTKCTQVTYWFSKFNLFDQTEILMRSCSAIWSGRNWGSIPWVQVLTKCTQVTFCSSRNWEKMAERSVRVGFQKIGFPFIDRNNSPLQYYPLLPVENCYRYISVLPVHWWFSRYL